MHLCVCLCVCVCARARENEVCVIFFNHVYYIWEFVHLLLIFGYSLPGFCHYFCCLCDLWWEKRPGCGEGLRLHRPLQHPTLPSQHHAKPHLKYRSGKGMFPHLYSLCYPPNTMPNLISSVFQVRLCSHFLHLNCSWTTVRFYKVCSHCLPHCIIPNLILNFFQLRLCSHLTFSASLSAKPYFTYCSGERDWPILQKSCLGI